MNRPLCPVPTLFAGALLGLVGCAGPDGAKPTPSPAATDTAGTPSDPPPPRDSAGPRDSSDSGGADTDPPESLYCRSLDPDWADAYIGPTDGALAELIAARGLLGDPTLYVDEEGECRRRPLPDIADPLPQLGRDLFFSPELSGDRDVACATCHHPALGGADALSLPLGVGFSPTTVGEDRPQGVASVDQLPSARHSPSVLNVALWDHRLMWDGRIEAVAPEAGFHGAEGGIATPDGPSTAPDLSTAQVVLPLADPHEMAGSLADGSTPPLEVIVARLADDTAWEDAFARPCSQPDALPTSWQDACIDSSLPLVQADHLAAALSAYQRSLVFVDTPWSAYVQGDVNAIPEAAKEGALAFYRAPAEGGLNCGSCHTGDFFSDEQLHAVGAPQIGPGDPFGSGSAGLDRGRQELSGDPADAFAFRTPTLLNVTTSAPYFHAGSIPTLFRAVVHYRGVEDSLEQTFGHTDEPLRRPPMWCESAGFSGISDCETLYGSEATHDGDLSQLDGELVDIGEASDTSSLLLVLFLETLTDPRLAEPAALSPWIPEGPGLPSVTATSDRWPDRCQQMVEWSQALDLRVKGARWLFKGARPSGSSESTLVDPDALFGRQYWDVFGRRYLLLTELARTETSIAAGVLALVSAAEQEALLDAWSSRSWDTSQLSWRRARAEVAVRMDRWRDRSESVDEGELATALNAVHLAEADGNAALATAYGTAWATLSEETRLERSEALRQYLAGDLRGLPEALRDPSLLALPLTDEAAARLADRGLSWDADLATFVLGYGTWTAGPDCVGGIPRRQDFGGRAAAYYGFGPWVNRSFFNLDTGLQEPVSAEEELAGLIAQLEQEAGFDGLDSALIDTNLARRAWTDALADAAAAARQLGADVAAGTDPTPAERALRSAHSQLATAESTLLAGELSYYFALKAALEPDQEASIVDWIDCLESPATQALRGNGGFDVHGGSCLP